LITTARRVRSRASFCWTIVVTWDEDDFSDSGQPGTGCCCSNIGGGHVATIVITNQGAKHVTDNTAYNHYSLLRTFEDAFGLAHLQHAGDATVPNMAPLFAADNQDQNQQ
jgi:phosphatidylinositol-3-phosphatase